MSNHNAIKLLKKVNEVANLLEEPSDWMKVVGSSAAHICDGMGAYKVFSKIISYKITLEHFGDVELHNYVNLSVDDKISALNMRNHSEVKKWMYNQQVISKESHFDFVQGLKSDTERRYFLVKQQQKIIGSINFSQIGLHNFVEFGLYTNPFEQLKGAGRILEAVAISYAFRELGVSKLKLEVFSNNERAINFYKKCGFKLTDMRKVNNKDILHMEKRKTVEGR